MAAAAMAAVGLGAEDKEIEDETWQRIDRRIDA
jgi:hypothetical protein